MSPRRVIVLIADLVLVGLIAGIAMFVSQPGRSALNERADARRGGAAEEAEEQAQTTDRRLQALLEAQRRGEVGRTSRLVTLAAPGWAGEQLIHPTADDWEPAIAADPAAPFVYVLTTRYTKSTDPACGNRCPLPFIALKISTNGGQTFGADRFLCACRGVNGQFDPIIEVVPGTGHVYAIWMNGFDTVFSKSTDRGQTWSAPVATYGRIGWTDKPVLAVSDTGQHVYVSWNGPKAGDPYVAQSHDFGATWTQTKIVDSNRYFFAYDADVLPNGTVVFAESSFLYGSGQNAQGQVQFHTISSTNQGSTWTTRLVDSAELGPACVAAGCSSDYYLGQMALTADATGALTILYPGATVANGPQTIWARRSTDAGATWTARTALSLAGANATFPTAEARGTGDVRAWYMEENGGPDAWNVWYRRSADGGLTWTAPVNISDVTSGTAYKTAAGFLEPYGDYGEIDVTSAGKTIGVWSEGVSYIGPGGTWLNRET